MCVCGVSNYIDGCLDANRGGEKGEDCPTPVLNEREKK